MKLKKRSLLTVLAVAQLAAAYPASADANTADKPQQSVTQEVYEQNAAATKAVTSGVQTLLKRQQKQRKQILRQRQKGLKSRMKQEQPKDRLRKPAKCKIRQQLRESRITRITSKP